MALIAFCRIIAMLLFMKIEFYNVKVDNKLKCAFRMLRCIRMMVVTEIFKWIWNKDLAEKKCVSLLLHHPFESKAVNGVAKHHSL